MTEEKPQEGDLILYRIAKDAVRVEVLYEAETFWLDQRRGAPHNIAQKTEVMVEHFHAVSRHRIGGRAKAMVVTGSRLEAVRYKQSFDKYIKDKGYAIKSLASRSWPSPAPRKTTSSPTSHTRRKLLFKNVLERLFVDRIDQNEDIFIRFMNDVPFQKVLTSWMAEQAYQRLRKSDGSPERAGDGSAVGAAAPDGPLPDLSV